MVHEEHLHLTVNDRPPPPPPVVIRAAEEVKLHMFMLALISPLDANDEPTTGDGKVGGGSESRRRGVKGGGGEEEEKPSIMT